MSRCIKVLSAGLAAFCMLGVGQAESKKSVASPSTATQPAANPSGAHPNILFVIMDDVGVDQMSSFGYGGPVPPKMPAIDTIAYHGIRFRNAWSMPECSPSRAAFFTGRWPLRNNINQAIGAHDLNNSQVAPWEITPPKLLAAAHYDSALIGKFHLGGQSVCEDNGGTWWGPGGVVSPALAECWQVNQVIYKNDPATYDNNKVNQNPQKAIAVRNQHYKLVHDEWYDYDPQTDGSMPVTSIEFYEVNEELPPLLLLDKDGSDLLQLPGGLNRKQQRNFDALQNQMNAVLASAPACPGDGNGDGVVNNKDVSDFLQIRDNWGMSSHYDFNFDALTNNDDRKIIRVNFGPCPKPAH